MKKDIFKSKKKNTLNLRCIRFCSCQGEPALIDFFFICYIIISKLYYMLSFKLYSKKKKKKNQAWNQIFVSCIYFIIYIFFHSRKKTKTLSKVTQRNRIWSMVYYFKATGISNEVDPPVTLYMGKHKEESE